MGNLVHNSYCTVLFMICGVHCGKNIVGLARTSEHNFKSFTNPLPADEELGIVTADVCNAALFRLHFLSLNKQNSLVGG